MVVLVLDIGNDQIERKSFAAVFLFPTTSTGVREEASDKSNEKTKKNPAENIYFLESFDEWGMKSISYSILNWLQAFE